MRRLRLPALLIIGLACGSAPAAAQVISVPKGGLTRDPALFVSGGIGLLAVQGVFDGTTQTGWDFSQALEYHAALEFGMARGSAIGVSLGYARVPLSYQRLVNTPGGGQGVLATDAHVSAWTLGGEFTLGPGSPGFHQVIVVNAGVIAFQNFHGDGGVGELPPKRDIDPRIGIGYGFGYGLKSRGEVYLVQEYGVALHQSEGLSGSDRRQYQQQTTRLGFRIGLGSR
ncbi:MAG TPA: hypothetical protein VHM30_11110 [Gemmatimonadaceae bacterium]|nr:hypothetical protein [Gemmatimonadaceae bacterium]